MKWCIYSTILCTLFGCGTSSNQVKYRMTPEAFVKEYMRNQYTAVKKFGGKKIRFDGILKNKVGEDIEGIFAVEFYGMDNAQAYE
ncbi:MAG: hypothetical protein K8I00_00410, partial [Candidatus Omnitrophica bacterium]|nr:hypothetical protein [Candidatus Omnitrophota bacterium]